MQRLLQMRKLAQHAEVKRLRGAVSEKHRQKE